VSPELVFVLVLVLVLVLLLDLLWGCFDLTDSCVRSFEANPNPAHNKIEDEHENEEDAGFSTLRIWATRP
jgi:hypothetical protein